MALALAISRWLGLFSERVYRGVLLAGGAVLGIYGLGLLGRGVSPDR